MAEEGTPRGRTQAIFAQAVAEKLSQLETRGLYRDEQIAALQRTLTELDTTVRVDRDGQRSLLARVWELERAQHSRSDLATKLVFEVLKWFIVLLLGILASGIVRHYIKLP